MDYSLFLLFVTILALVYSFLVRAIQMKTGNQKEMQALQAESKRLNDDYKKAADRKDQKNMDELMKQQMELFPKMNGLMMGQFKSFIPILLVFFAFTWVINNFDPTTKDDIFVQLNDNGTSCDRMANDLIYSGCATLNGTTSGIWNVRADFVTEDKKQLENSSYFYYIDNSSNYAYHKEKGAGFIDGVLGNVFPAFSVTTDKTSYAQSEEVNLYVKSSVKGTAVASLDSGTLFAVKVPVIGIVIYEVYWWFIIITFISGFVISWAMNKTTNKPKAGA